MVAVLDLSRYLLYTYPFLKFSRFFLIFTQFATNKQTKNLILLIYKNIKVKIWSSVVVFARRLSFHCFLCLFLFSYCDFVFRTFDTGNPGLVYIRLGCSEETIDDQDNLQKDTET